MKNKIDFLKDNDYEEAKKKVNERVGFYIHLSVYLIVNSFVLILSWMNGQPFAAIYAMVLWGLGLTLHGINVFGVFNNLSWKNRQIQNEINRQRRRKL